MLYKGKQSKNNNNKKKKTQARFKGKRSENQWKKYQLTYDMEVT